MGTLIIFREGSFIFSFLGLWISDKVIWGWVHIWRGDGQNKMLKDECESFYNQIRMNNLI
jgi:hypothetical protein